VASALSIRIGSGAAWWGDRISPARLNAEQGRLDYLCFETMSEATISTAAARRLRNPDFSGYDTYLDDRFEAVIDGCRRNGTRIVTNQGWVAPERAAERIAELFAAHGEHGVRIAAVTGNVVTDRVQAGTDLILETGRPTSDLDPESILSAEVYLGAEAIVAALAQGADVVVTGRVADPSLFLAPMVHEFGWSLSDWPRLGQGSGIGHLLECGAQVTGGYFADPGYKDVPRPWDLAFPIATVEPDGSAVLSKIEGTGGLIDRDTVLEQMFYEVHDPSAYLTPDVSVDFTTADIEVVGSDRVSVSGIGGRPRPEQLKVSIGCREGFIGEDMFFYAGPGALDRAQLARQILEERFKIVDLDADDVRIDILGWDAIHGSASRPGGSEPYEVAVRVAARTRTADEAAKIGREVDGMAVSGVGMTGKHVPQGERVRDIVGVWSTLIARDEVAYALTFTES
jgi:hypothetical protein